MMTEESDAESPRLFVEKKLSELALAARNTRAQVFRASTDTDMAAANDDVPLSSAHRARALRSHYQRHYQDVHGMLKAAEPVRKPVAKGPNVDSSTSDSGGGGVTVLNSLQQFNFFSYFMPTLTTSDAQQDSMERSEMVPSPPPPSLASTSSSSPSSQLFGFTSPTYIVPSAYSPPPPTTMMKPQLIPQDIPPQRQPTPPPVPAEDDLSWVPKFSTAQRISPLERREKFAAAQSMVNSAVVDGLGSDVGKLGSFNMVKSSSKSSKSVTINLTPMKSFQEGGGLYGAPLTIAPGANLDIDTFLGTPRDKKNDVEGDDEEDDTKVEVDFALHVELSPGGARRRSSCSSSSSSVSFFNDDGMSSSRSSVDTTSPGPVSELIGIFERKEEGAAAAAEGSSVIDTAVAEKRMAMLETVAEKLALMMEQLIQERGREREKQPPTPTPLTDPVFSSAAPSANVSEELYSDLSRTLAELRHTLTSQVQIPPSPSSQAPSPTHSTAAEEAVVDDIPAPFADPLSSTVSQSSSSDEGASTVDPENTAVKSLDALQSELEALRIERDQEREKTVQRVETMQSEQDALRRERDNATQQLELTTTSKDEAMSSLRQKVIALEAETEALKALQIYSEPPVAAAAPPPIASSSATQTEKVQLTSTPAQTVPRAKTADASTAPLPPTLTLAAAMQTDAPTPVSAPTTTTSVTVQTMATTSLEVVEAEHAEALRDLKAKLVASEQGRFEADLRLEEALLEAEKQRLQSVMELSKMRRNLASEKEGMEQLARDLEETFETLALTLVELSMEREEDLL